MFDFTLSDSGDLVLDKESSGILKASHGYLIRQLALVRIKSVSQDWFNHKDLGANLEDMIGTVLPSKIQENLNEAISSSLSDIINTANIFVASKFENKNILLKVYLKITESETVLINVTLDTIGGVTAIYAINP